MTIWVTLFACAKPTTSSAMRRSPPGMVTGSPPKACASRKRVGDAVALLLGELQAALGLDIERRPGGVQAVGQALGVAHQPCGARVFADADEQALARGPGTRDGPRLHLVEQLLVDALGRAPERELAQSGEIGRREEVLERALGLLGDVDLALFQALDQVVGGEVDELDGVGAIEDRVRHGLAHADTGDLRHDVVQAFDVLDVERRVDVDALAQQLFDVEIALGVPAAGDIGVGELVDERQVRAARDQGVEIHLLERVILVRRWRGAE